MNYPTIESCIGGTPLIRLQRMGPADKTVLLKLEGDNPAGSVKDRPALEMIQAAEERGDVKPGDTLVEPTSGNTGIALAMSAAIRGYRLVLIMPEHLSLEKRQILKAYGAELILVTEQEGMERARDIAVEIHEKGEAYQLNQFDNPGNSRAHYKTTGSEIWEATGGEMTHFVAPMATTGTVSGTGRYLKDQNEAIEVTGVYPADGEQVQGMRRDWPERYIPKIKDMSAIDQEIPVTYKESESVMREMASREGIFAGISSGGCLYVALQIAREAAPGAVVVSIVCDRGDRYLAAGMYG